MIVEDADQRDHVVAGRHGVLEEIAGMGRDPLCAEVLRQHRAALRGDLGQIEQAEFEESMAEPWLLFTVQKMDFA